MIVMSEVNRKAEGDYQLQILATNLRNIREKRRLSQEDVEELTGVSVNEISKIERKLTKPRLDVLAALAKGLEVDIRQLLDPCLDPAAASFCPDGNLMEQVGSALTGRRRKNNVIWFVCWFGRRRTAATTTLKKAKPHMKMGR